MPDLSTPRSRLDKDSRAIGITPFTPMSSGDGDGDAEDNKPSSMMTTVSDGEVTVSWSEKTKKMMNSEMLDPNTSSVSVSSTLCA